MYSDSLRFQKFPLCRAFPNVYGYGVRTRRIRVHGKRNRKEVCAVTYESGYVETGPKSIVSVSGRFVYKLVTSYKIKNLLTVVEEIKVKKWSTKVRVRSAVFVRNKRC